MKIFNTIRLCLLLIIPILLADCAGNCPVCKKSGDSDKASKAIYNVELRQPIENPCTKEKVLSVRSDAEPKFVPYLPPIKRKCCDTILPDSTKGDIWIHDPDCGDDEKGCFSIPKSFIRKITSMSEPFLKTPVEIDLGKPCKNCDRIRDGWLFFDKVEIRAFSGFRLINDSIAIPGKDGLNVYKSSFYSTETGGSNLVLGGEIGLMWSLPFIDPTDGFQAGVMTGIWPTDGSIFMPLALHLRYTFNQHPNIYTDRYNCHALYFFGDAGIPFDFHSEAPVPGNRYFWDLGIGVDFAISCPLDFSIDIGIRQMNLPLQKIDCCPDIPEDERNFYRLSTLGFLRFGFTW